MSFIFDHFNLKLPKFLKVIFRKFSFPILTLIVILLPASLLQLVPESRLAHSSRSLIRHLTQIKKLSILTEVPASLITAYRGAHGNILLLSFCPHSLDGLDSISEEKIIYEGPIDTTYSDIQFEGRGLSGEVISSHIICYDAQRGFQFDGESQEEFLLTLKDRRPEFLGENDSNTLRLNSQIRIDGNSGAVDFRLL